MILKPGDTTQLSLPYAEEVIYLVLSTIISDERIETKDEQGRDVTQMRRFINYMVQPIEYRGFPNVEGEAMLIDEGQILDIPDDDYDTVGHD